MTSLDQLYLKHWSFVLIKKIQSVFIVKHRLVSSAFPISISRLRAAQSQAVCTAA